MDIGSMLNLNLSAQEQTRTQLQVDAFNKTLEVNGRTNKQELGKDDFLQLLITQLTHQDPTAPMEDTQFIAQMAQFSSLEQMTNMSTGLTKMSTLLTSSEATASIGKHVEIENGEAIISGTISAASIGEFPQVKVNGEWFNWSLIKTVYAQDGGTTL